MKAITFGIDGIWTPTDAGWMVWGNVVGGGGRWEGRDTGQVIRTGYRGCVANVPQERPEEL